MLKRIPSKPLDCRAAVPEGCFLIVSPFKNSVRHVTAKTAATRNLIVAEIASAAIVAHAAPGSKIEALNLKLLAAGKPVYTFDRHANATRLTAGAQTIRPTTDWKSHPGRRNSDVVALRPIEDSRPRGT